MNSLYDFRKPLKDIGYSPISPFRKGINWKTWAKADGKLLIPKFKFYRDAENIFYGII